MTEQKSKKPKTIKKEEIKIIDVNSAILLLDKPSMYDKFSESIHKTIKRALLIMTKEFNDIFHIVGDSELLDSIQITINYKEKYGLINFIYWDTENNQWKNFSKNVLGKEISNLKINFETLQNDNYKKQIVEWEQEYNELINTNFDPNKKPYLFFHNY